MARIRTIKPSFFESEDVAALPFRARLLWIGLWTQCDDAGRTKDNVRLIKARIWPLDPVNLADIEEDLTTLADHGRIVRYEVDGRRYLEVVNFGDHQTINRPTPSKLPAPPSTGNGSYPQVSTHGALTEDSHQEGKGKEGKGRGRENVSAHGTPDSARQPERPPPRCPKHLHNPTTDPCGPCKDARLTAEAWDRQQAQHRAERDRANQRHPRCGTCGQRHGPDECPVDPKETR